MDRLPRLEKKLLVITLGLALSSTLVVFLSIFYSSIPVPNQNIKRDSEDYARYPASTDSADSVGQPVSIQHGMGSGGSPNSLSMSTLDLNCLRENKSWDLNSTPKMLQIKGQLCGGGNLSKIEIINRSNGTKAVVFQLKGERFLSDYISLSPGFNQLVLEAESSSGRRFVNNFKLKAANDLSK